jgi:hypothetical protein
MPEPAPSPEASKPKSSPVSELPEDVVDFDKETLNDPFQVSLYAMDIFNYLKEREVSQPFLSWDRNCLAVI